jgi:hypothetical protein
MGSVTRFFVCSYMQSIKHKTMNNFCNLLISMHSPRVAFLFEHTILRTKVLIVKKFTTDHTTSEIGVVKVCFTTDSLR